MESFSDMKLLEALHELDQIVRNRLHFSARLEYVYASQMAKMTRRASMSGESLGRLETRLADSHKQREECLGVRDSIITSLKEQLDQQRLTGSQAVHSCRAQAHTEYEEVKRCSENNLESLKASLEENILTMRSHELRDEEEELELRKRRQDLEGEILRRIRHYDATMSSLQTTLDSLREEDKALTLLLKNKKTIQSGRIQPDLSCGLKVKSHRVWAPKGFEFATVVPNKVGLYSTRCSGFCFHKYD
ncbi:hypothetical protein SK128_004248 [Halocaridina rubra]|uniref:Dynein regulatory complex protein 10 n=1 Tax=Halocaridina rubra TaxID=373956 RepID=A0AAN9A7Z9_HALRR